ncbi:MAG: hypothetical protein JRE19_15770, partial [Deltaproteobacteria bacterium]|nr:hypothetical protein [Deltaproteobacteria bacterium]
MGPRIVARGLCATSRNQGRDAGAEVIAGGDLNTFFYFGDLDGGPITEPAVKSFVDRGYVDAH